MPRYYFHLAGDVPAHDVLGSECADDAAAQQHAEIIANRVGSEKPEMIADRNYISIVDERDVEVGRAPLASAEA